MLIRPEEMKALIKNIPLIKAAHGSMKSSLDRMVENVDDSIYSAYMGGNIAGGGVPPVGSVSDKVGNIALKRVQNCIGLDTKQLQNDVNILSDLISCFENGLKILTKMQKNIVDLRHTVGEERAWKEVAIELKTKEIFFSVSHIRKIYDYAIRQLIMASQITVETYNEVMEIIQGRGD